ncbi:hypothetical protein [Stutzerimonas nitrititolerans]|uniref:hypothetical protein n=1 Tax=Stutzerimonas nitrititolerans TaxID=2482751 RepID=UPI0028A6068C|nr:hypothetical protein [Stutzerimonas nitrititolerans]
MISIFMRLVDGPLITHTVAYIQLSHQLADDPHPARYFTNRGIFFTKALDAEKSALPQDSVRYVQNNHVGLFNILWRRVLNVTFDYFESFWSLGHPYHQSAIALQT